MVADHKFDEGFLVQPFEQIVTQYSIHQCSAPGKIIGVG